MLALRLAFVSSAVVALAALDGSTAIAQSEPACDCAPGAAPVAAPQTVIVVAPRPQGWLGQRWGVGLRGGSMALRPESAPDAEPTQFAVGGVQLRYRLNARWELELAAEHAHEQLADGTAGVAELGIGTIGVLFHMQPHRRWDWYLVGAIGAAHDARPELSEEERVETAQAVVQAGIGLERRFRHFGVAAELRAIGMAPVEHEHGDDAGDDVDTRALIAPGSDARVGTAGGQLTIAATYYF